MEPYNNIVLLLILSSLVMQCPGELYITSLPRSIELSQSSNSLNQMDIPHVINYLMGFPTPVTTTWKGVLKADVFNRPRANLFINLYIPDGIHFSLPKFSTRYEVHNVDQTNSPPMEETNLALTNLFGKERPMIVDYELDGQVLSTSHRNADVLGELPHTLELMQERLRQSKSIASDLDQNSCLDISHAVDAYFLGELQTLQDILNKLQNDRTSVNDEIQDSFYFSLTAIDGLIHTYGIQSCQVKQALNLLQDFISTYVNDFNELYDENLLSEVNIANSVVHSFDVAKIRRARSLQQTDADGKIQNVADMLQPDYPAMINISFWVFVVFALATLGSSYFLWYMDPGRDGIIYRMTSQRMKID